MTDLSSECGLPCLSHGRRAPGDGIGHVEVGQFELLGGDVQIDRACVLAELTRQGQAEGGRLHIAEPQKMRGDLKERWNKNKSWLISDAIGMKLKK